MKFLVKPCLVEAERVGTILHAAEANHIETLPKWIREALETGDIEPDAKAPGWLYYNKRSESVPRYVDADSWLIQGVLGYVFSLSDAQFRAGYAPAECAETN